MDARDLCAGRAGGRDCSSRPDVARVGSALLFAALVQGIVYRYGAAWQLEQPWIAALLAHATLMAIGCAALIDVAGTAPCAVRALAAATIGRAARAHCGPPGDVLGRRDLVAATVHTTSAGTLAVNLAWLAGVWMLLAALAVSPVAVYGVASRAACWRYSAACTAAVETREWYAAARHPWLDPWFLEAQGIALAAYCLVFGAVRWLFAAVGWPWR